MSRAVVEPRTSSITVVSGLSTNARNVQSAYQQSDVSFFTARKPNEIPTNINEVIVLQYGSRNFKVGLAKDALPRSGIQVIAYRNASFKKYSDNCDEITDEELQERLAIRYKNAKKKPPPNIYTSLISFNRTSTPQAISALNDAYGFEWVKTNGAKFITGQAALRINPEEPYTKRWPIQKGNFNRQQYHSYREVIDDLDMIWSNTIVTELRIFRRDFVKYGLILVVPNGIKGFELKALTELVVRQMRFKSVAFLQESVSGTFGTGISTACVIDVGAQCTKVCCIEDGQIIHDTHTINPYGGERLTHLFFQILKLHNFPYADCDMSKDLDFGMMDELKIRMCTMDEDDLVSAVYEAYVRDPGQATKVYPFKVFEERIVVPNALFEEGVPLLKCEKSSYDADVLRFYTGEYDATDIYLSSTDNPEDNDSTTAPMDMKSIKEEKPATEIKLISLTEALQKALDHLDGASNPDRLKKFLSSILVIGNGHKFKKFINHIEEILISRYPGFEIDFVLGRRSGSIAGGKENLTLDPGIVAWKGGAIFSKLDCISDFYISLRDYETGGARAFRERLTFTVN